MTLSLAKGTTESTTYYLYPYIHAIPWIVTLASLGFAGQQNVYQLRKKKIKPAIPQLSGDRIIHNHVDLPVPKVCRFLPSGKIR
jgi:hypothetical protein